MSRERELLKELIDGEFLNPRYANEQAFIERVKAELAKPEPEPIKWFDERHNDVSNVQRVGWVPLYTSPPRREPLSDEGIISLRGSRFTAQTLAFYEGFRAAEKAHWIGG